MPNLNFITPTRIIMKLNTVLLHDPLQYTSHVRWKTGHMPNTTSHSS